MRPMKTLRCTCPCGFEVEGDPDSAAQIYRDHRHECVKAEAPWHPGLSATDKIRQWPSVPPAN